MLDGLNQYGLPLKYGIIGFVSGIIGTLLLNMLGSGSGGVSYISIPVAAGLGGAVGGWLRQKKGRRN